MFSSIWHHVFFDPIYNALIYLIDVVPGGDVGLAIVLLTVVVKVVILPLSLKAAHTQHAMRALEPTLAAIKEKYKKDREALARETMAAYKNAGVNPFASVLLIFIQLPIIIALYLSIFRGGGVPLPDINIEILYAFVQVPEAASMHFLGFIDIASRNLPLAALAGITQFIHTKLAFPPAKPRDKDAQPNMKDDFQRSMQMQMRYGMPILIFFIAYTISAAIALYFVVSNIASIAQEFIVRRKIPNRHEVTNGASHKKEEESVA